MYKAARKAALGPARQTKQGKTKQGKTQQTKPQAIA